MYSVELISIGNELLSGRTLNSHARDLGGALSAIGLKLMRDTTIPDEIEIITSETRAALQRVDLVFVSGGLGPTVDDITRDALATVLNRKIILDQETVTHITKRYDARGRVMTPAAERQALVLDQAVVLPNSVGAAPGERIELPDNKYLFILPGPPHEFNAIVNEEIIPWLRKRYPDAQPDLLRSIWTQGIYESDIATLLEKESVQPQHVSLGFYPANGRVEIRITATPDHADDVDQTRDLLAQLLSDFIIETP